MAQVAARGPLTFLLQSSSGQYVALGLGAYALFPDHVKQFLAPLLGDQYLKYLADSGKQLQHQGQMQPIIIQTPPSTIIHHGSQGGGVVSSKSLTQVLIYSIAGAGACWVGYIVCSQLLPDAVSEFMPVTKRLFKNTSEALGASITQVKEALQQQLQVLVQQQDRLATQQKSTHKSVEDVKGELGKARSDLTQLQCSIDNVEAGMDESRQLQGYTLKGIQLLVRCVTSFLPDESHFIDDISQYIQDDHAVTTSSRHKLPPATKPNHHNGLRVGRAAPPLQPPKLTMVSSTGTANSNLSMPNISSIESSYDEEESDEEDEIPGGNYMGDIRALLGH